MSHSRKGRRTLHLAILIFLFSGIGGAKPGGIDRSFGNNGFVVTSHGNISNILGYALQPDGKSIFVGSIANEFYATRFNADGSLDTSFDGDGRVSIPVTPQEDIATGVVVGPDGKIVICGYARNAAAWRDFAVVRLNENGSLDTSFDQDGIKITSISPNDDYAIAVALQADGKIVVAGHGVHSSMTMQLVRYNTDGSPDSTFDGDGIVISPFTQGAANSADIVIQGDGKIVVAGSVGLGGQFINSVFAVARFNTDGTPDNTFGTEGKVIADVRIGTAQQNFANRVLLQPDGKIVAAGGSNSGLASSLDFALLRLNANGTPDNSFGDAGKVVTVLGPNDDSLRSLAIQADGKLLAGGIRRISSSASYGLVRYNTNGTLDTLFGNNGIAILSPPDVESGIDLLQLLPEGRIKAFSFGRFNASFFKFFEKGYVDADFDADGKTDIGIARPLPLAEWWINRSSTGITFALQFGASTDRIAPADYTGDAKVDIAFFRPSSGEWYVLRSEDFSFFAVPFGTNGDVPVPADYDTDGKADFAVFRPSAATWFISQSSGAPTQIVQFGVNGDQPVVADYDSDGKADIGIFRNNAGVGEWWIQRSTAGLLAMQFGSSTDKPVQGDYTGDGKADIAIWRPATGEWLIVRSEDFSFFGFPFGTNGDIVAPGDYDGDGKFDATVFRPSSATWFIARSTAGTQIVQFGATGDQPVANAFVP